MKVGRVSRRSSRGQLQIKFLDVGPEHPDNEMEGTSRISFSLGFHFVQVPPRLCTQNISPPFLKLVFCHV